MPSFRYVKLLSYGFVNDIPGWKGHGSCLHPILTNPISGSNSSNISELSNCWCGLIYSFFTQAFGPVLDAEVFQCLFFNTSWYDF